MAWYRLDLLGTSEAKCTGFEEKKFRFGHTLIYSGKEESKTHERLEKRETNYDKIC